MTILRAQVNIPRDNLLPEDDAVNVWHFLTVGAASPAAGATSISTQLGVFYAAVDSLYASYMSTPYRIKIYDLQNPEPRVPILEVTGTFTSGTGDGLPGEVAAVLSYRAFGVSGENPARRRGRIYIGPLAIATQVFATRDMVLTSAARSTLANAASDLVVSGATADARWVVFSPTQAGSPPWDEATLEAASSDVQNGWIDDAFDTMRSRGSKPTVRTVFSEILP